VPSRDPSGPPVDPDSLKALIVAQPKAFEDGFRVLEVDLSAGRAGIIDILGLDRSGALTLLAVTSGDPDAVLLRLLDQQVWVADQRDLLRRIHDQAGLDLERPVRALLLSPTFTERFLRRLELFAQPVTALLARVVTVSGQGLLLIEAAAPIFGLAIGPSFKAAVPVGPPEERRERPRPFEAPAERAVAVPVTAELLVDPNEEAEPLPDPFADEVEPADPFETLTTEELDEFGRFESERRSRRRNPA